ncbi:MAG: long-chain-fatty-acid--CoA ligase [Pseudomonadota bacterium]|nr:long-chain-fatty-acid--CoA ligase [Pseudomonadota bacterium]
MTRCDGTSTLAHVLRRTAQSQPNATAQVFRDRTTSYADFDRHASQVANGLVALGARPQTRIGYLGKNSDLFFELLFGCLKINVVLVPVNWRLAAPEAAAILADAGADITFVGPGYAPMIAAIECQSSRRAHRISLDGASPDWPDFAAWRDAQPASDPEISAAPDDTALQLYTSGTTGLPKGVELTNRNYLSLFETWRVSGVGAVGPADVVLTCMPVYHVAGSDIGLVALVSGAKNVIMEEVNVAGILDLVPRHGITYALFVPAVVLALVQHADTPNVDFSSLTKLLYGASPIAEDTVLRARALLANTGFWHLYGLTETTGGGAFMPAEMHDPGLGKLRSCGHAYPGTELCIVGPTGNTLPAGEVGEIVIRHACVMKGYWNNPEVTRAAFFDGGWLRTGDSAYADDEGFIYIHDRIKDMILTGAENVYPAEVENALFGHPAIADCAVIGIPDERWGEAVKAFVVLRPGAAATAEDIIAHARERIAGYKLPKSIDFVESLPRNPTGKLLRRKLRAPYWAGRARQVE